MFDFASKKISGVTAGFLPRTVLVPLCQEKGVLCEPLVKKGMRVQEGQIIAEPRFGGTKNFDAAKIHSPIPGLVLDIRPCSFPDGKCGDAVEILLSGEFSHIGKKARSFDWRNFGGPSILNRMSVHGVLNTFSFRDPCSLAASIRKIAGERPSADFSKRGESSGQSGEKRIFVRLYDEDASCKTDSVLANFHFMKIIVAVQILSEIIFPSEVVFAYSKNDSEVIQKLSELKSASENSSEKWGALKNAKMRFVAMNEKKFGAGSKSKIASRYKKNMQLEDSAKAICESSLFVDAQTLCVLHDAVVLNIPETQVSVNVFGDCLKSSAVLKVCVGTSFGALAQEAGLCERQIGKIVVNGFERGFCVPTMDVPVTKYVKSVSFISKRDIADYSVAYCTGCGKCRVCCPEQIYPDILYSSLANSAKIPDEFFKASVLCSECGLCSSVCPANLPLFESVKIIKERQNGHK